MIDRARSGAAAASRAWSDVAVAACVLAGAGAGATGWTSGLPIGAQLASAAMVAGALGVLAWDLCAFARRRPWRLVPAPSPSGILLGLGISLAIIGAATRLWLTLFGIDAALLGLVALAAELRGAMPLPPTGD
jgi:hypothetical protein